MDKNGHPYIKVRVFGLNDQFAQEFEVMIDTGFTGFLLLPITSAFPLALTLFGTSNYTLADGTVQAKLIAFGTVELEGERASGTIVLEPNATGPLVGMDYLRKCKKALFLITAGVFLLDEDEFMKSIRAPSPPPKASS